MKLFARRHFSKSRIIRAAYEAKLAWAHYNALTASIGQQAAPPLGCKRAGSVGFKIFKLVNLVSHKTTDFRLVLRYIRGRVERLESVDDEDDAVWWWG